MNRRIERLNELLREEVSNIILFKLKDPRIGFVSVSKVELSGDLRTAKVFVGILGKSNEDVTKTMEGLRSAVGFIKKEISNNIRLKFIPDIKFIYDDTVEYTINLFKKIEEIKNDENKN
jgi:ribosome-binding factor A